MNKYAIKPQKFFENIGKRLIELNDLSIEKFEGNYVEKGFEQLSQEHMKRMRELEMILNKEGYLVGYLYADEKLIYQAVNGKMIPKMFQKNKRDRNFYITVYDAVFRELGNDNYRYK